MFGWLAKLLVSSPVVGSGCSCCEGKKENLRRMQEAIAEGISENPTEIQNKCACSTAGACDCNREQTPHEEIGWHISSASLRMTILKDGRGQAEIVSRKTGECQCQDGNNCHCGHQGEAGHHCHCGKH